MAETIGRLIKRLRLQAGYESLGELYRASGVQVSTLSRIESGSQIPQPDTLKKLAPYLHASVEQLMIAAGHLPGNNKAIQNKNNDLEQQWPEGIKVLRRAQSNLTPEKRKKMLRLIEAYIEDEENASPKNKK